MDDVFRGEDDRMRRHNTKDVIGRTVLEGSRANRECRSAKCGRGRHRL